MEPDTPKFAAFDPQMSLLGKRCHRLSKFIDEKASMDDNTDDSSFNKLAKSNISTAKAPSPPKMNTSFFDMNHIDVAQRPFLTPRYNLETVGGTEKLWFTPVTTP